MADITTFYPGGEAGQAVPHAIEADNIDDQGVATPLFFWSGSQADYDTIVTEYNNDNTSHPDFLRTIYYTVES